MLIRFILLFSVIFSAHSEETNLNTPLPSDYILGNKDAKITIIEYSSLSCPSCAFFHNKIFPSVKAELIDTGKVNYIHRNYPLDSKALEAAKLLLCSDQNSYYKYLDSLFETQVSWAINGDVVNNLKSIALLGGMPSEAFEKCFHDKSIENKINSSKQEAHSLLKINATPTFIINGKMLTGAPNKEKILSVIEELNAK